VIVFKSLFHRKLSLQVFSSNEIMRKSNTSRRTVSQYIFCLYICMSGTTLIQIPFSHSGI